MRLFSRLFLLILVSCNAFAAKGCPGDNYLKMAVGRFDLCLPIAFYKNATITTGGGIIAKLSDGSAFSAQVLTPEMDTLPESFDMRAYPEQILGLKSATGLTKEQSESLANSIAVLKEQFGSNKPNKFKRNGKTFHTISKAGSAIAYVTCDEIGDQALLFTFEKIHEGSMGLILDGVQ